MRAAGRFVGTCGLLALSCLAADPGSLPETIVLAERRDPAGRALATWDAEEIERFSPRTLDELLATDPSFSLYRRQSSLFGNPTSAGVSLRNTGATAASRTLVLRDGIPQNDPFGGWVHWARYDPWTLESARIVPAARSAVWGNLSSAGSVQLTSREITGDGGFLRATGGSQGTLGATLADSHQADDGSAGISFTAFGLHSDGFHALPSWQRGAIDRKLDLDLAGAEARMVWHPDDRLTLEPSISWYEESRGNGTPLTGNSTEALDASLRLTSDGARTSWQLLGYYQHRTFESVFSSVNPDRSAETLALDQFNVPGEGLGGAFIVRHEAGDGLEFTTGTDLRLLSGETHEDVGVFRRRRAGGEQNLAGIFGTAAWEPGPATRVDGSLRLDHWTLTDGIRRETSLSSGALLRNDPIADRSGWEPSGALALSQELGDSLIANLAAGSAFRLPSLNELHRPFRVRNDIVEANPALRPERFYNLEAGLEWTANECLTLRADFFQHWIHDAIANVPITDPAQIAAIFGSLPPGGTGSQRRNVDEASVSGLQASAEWRPDEVWTLRGGLLWSRTEFTESADQPLLEGKPFPQAPDLRLNGSVDARVSESVNFFAGAEYGASQYDDALAVREVPSFWTFRAGASWRVHRRLSLHARVENLLDEEVVTGLSGDGILSTGQPRAFWLAAEWSF